MKETILKLLSETYSVESRKVGEYQKMDGHGMHFHLEGYQVKGLGYLSILTMKGMMGLMKMESLILVPEEKDAPLFSYDAMDVFKKNTLIVELYNTQVEPLKEDFLSPLDEIKKSYESLPLHPMKPHWYDSLKYKESFAFKGKKIKERLNQLSEAYFQEFLSLAEKAPQVDINKKRQKTSSYVQGLLDHGGPAVDQFKKMIGEEKTKEVFTKYVFHVED